ncbi:MAG: type 3 dihydrofolate reductase [Pseudomonadota bacterium]
MQMRVSIVVARARNGVIGAGNALPWRLPADLKHFRRVTLGKPVIMGRKTWESIGKPLADRRNIVISRNPAFAAAGAETADSIEAALAMVADARDVMVIGGADIYREALPYVTRMYVTEVHADIKGDTVFPEFDITDWREARRADHPADEANAHAYSFVVLEKVQVGATARPA